ncbi:MAG: outer membrane beta-barrel protein [Pseudomonadota bacterium]|nr:hypothetical protein [Alphaproteobacteria bacterium]
MRQKILACAAVGLGVLSATSLGHAAPKGPFVGIMGGANFTDDQDISGTGVGINRSVDTDTGWAVLPSIGYRYGNGVRTELELGYRTNDVDSLSGAVGGSGELTAKSVMLNLLYDFNIGGRVSPYIGAGAGYAQVDYDSVAPVGAGRIDDEENVFAYQGIAGLSYWLNNSVELAAEYRYFATQDPDFRTSAGVPVEGEYNSHAALIGFRINFGAPAAAEPAPVAPAPAPAPAPVAEPEPPALPRNFIVFFDWDRSDITAEADAILRDAVAYAQQHGAVRISATGHADRSGSDEYNMKLSMRRAKAVESHVIASGIAASEISIAAKGEREPLVPTEDGVREPQNRRVEIILE